ncbi:MAG: hypothetical protein KIG60_08020 [Caryophanon sp.]|nr:hypothetical protein [Caryophanon sp.]
MTKLETMLHIFMWSVLTMNVFHELTASAQPVFFYLNVIDIAIFTTTLIAAYPCYRVVKRTMFGGAMPLSAKGIAHFFNVDEQRVKKWQLPTWINGGNSSFDRLVILWSYSFLLYFATLIDISRELLLFYDGTIATQKFLICLSFVGIVSFFVAWLFRLPRSKA